MQGPKPKIYGEWQLGVREIRADRILGLQLRFGPDGKPEAVGFQFDSPMGRHGVTFAFQDMMFLWSCLRGMQLDMKTPMPRDPRASPGDAGEPWEP